MQIHGIGPSVGGAHIHTYLLSRGLQEDEDFEVIVVSPKAKSPFLSTKLDEAGIKHYILSLNGISPFRFLRNLYKLIRIVGREQVHVIHSHLRNADIYAGIVAKLMSRNAISTLHGLTIDVEKSATLMEIFKRSIHGICVRDCMKKLVAISKYVRDRNSVDLGIDPGRIEVIYNCNDLEALAIHVDEDSVRRSLSIPNRDNLVALVGGLVRQKRPMHFLKVAERVCRKRDKVTFLVVGDGPERPRLEEYVWHRSLQNKVIFTGMRRDIPEIMNVIDILVITAAREGFGRTAVEAMAAKKPVVAFENGGPAEIVLHGQTGYLAEDGNVNSMANHILDLLSNPERARKFGQQGYKRAEELFSLQPFLAATKATTRACALAGKS